MFLKNTIETTAKEGVILQPKEGQGGTKVSDLTPAFIKYAQYELSFSTNTIEKYRDSLRWFVKDLGDLQVEALTPGHFIELKRKMVERGSGSSHISSRIFAMKSFLQFCREALGLNVMDPKEIRPPKRARREVIYLDNEEVRQFVDGISVYNVSRGYQGVKMSGLRFRTLVEVLLGTGMRISEALSLNRDSIDFEKGEAKIIGKGNKERTVFFTPRSLEWIRFLLKERKDEHQPVFVTTKGTRLKTYDISYLFGRYREKSGINKKITPHILRHTVATALLFNGCPISHVKEILGHSQLETTCRFYLGIDKGKAKEAHGQFLSF